MGSVPNCLWKQPSFSEMVDNLSRLEKWSSRGSLVHEVPDAPIEMIVDGNISQKTRMSLRSCLDTRGFKNPGEKI